MIIKIQKFILVKRLEESINFLNKKPILPITEMLQVNIKDSLMTFNTTDLENSYEGYLPLEENCHCEYDFHIIEPTKLSSFLKKCNDEIIEFKIEDTLIKFKVGKDRFNSPILSDQEPLEGLFTEKMEDAFTIDFEDFKKLIIPVNEYAADDELRPIMNGVFIDNSETKAIFVATDAHKLFVNYSDIELNKNIKTEGIVLSSSFLNKIRRLTTKEPAKILFSKKSIVIELGAYKISSRLIDGNYPAYKTIMPKDFETSVTLDKNELVKIVDKSMIVDNATNLLALQFSKNKLYVKSENIDTNSKYETTLEYNSILDGKEITIGLSKLNLISILKSFNSDEVTFNMTLPSTAIIIKAKEEKEKYSLIMPMMIS